MTRYFPFAFAAWLTVALAVAPAAAQDPVRLTLADAIARGFETSHRLAEIRAREQGAQAAARTADLATRPTVSASAGYTRTNHVEEFAVPQPNGNRLVVYPDLPNNVVTRVGFQWPIFTAGRADALERAAQAEAAAIGEEIATARADLRLEIVRAYWAVVTAREAVRVLEESAARTEAQVADARQRFNVGLIPPNEVMSLEAQRSRERALAIEAGNARESALIDLRRLTGLPAGTVIDLSDSLDDSSGPGTTAVGADDQVAAAIAVRPERRAMERRVSALEARREAVLATSRPTLSLVGGWDYANPNPRIFPRRDAWQDSWDVGVTVNWNVFDFGRVKSQAAETAAAVSASRARLAEFDAIASADIRQRLLDVNSSRALVVAAADAVRSAAEARRVVGDRFTAGVATSTDVLVVQTALLEAELAHTRALAGVRLAEARLERVAGQAP